MASLLSTALLVALALLLVVPVPGGRDDLEAIRRRRGSRIVVAGLGAATAAVALAAEGAGFWTGFSLLAFLASAVYDTVQRRST